MAPRKITLLILLLGLAACQTPPPPTVTVVGLWPEAPPLTYKPFDLWTGGNTYLWPVVKDEQPTLRWETFPRPGDLAADAHQVLAQATAVRYDLRIWRSADGFPGELVYARDGLPQATHRVEQPLPPGREYFWSVRARFTLYGQTRVIDWSRIESPLPLGAAGQGGRINYPDARYYRFWTR